MGSLLLFIQNISTAVYIFAGVGVLWFAYSLLNARSELSIAQFRLEREHAEERGGRAITFIIILIEVGILVWLLSTVTYDAWADFSDAEVEVVEAPSVFSTSVPLSGDAQLEVPTSPPDFVQIQSTARPSPTPAGTVRPADDREGCLFDQANIDRPDNGQVIYEVEEIWGTANIPNFGYFRFEIRNLEDPNFGVIGGTESDYTEPVINGPLGSIIPQNFISGEYRFRLVVFDTAGTARATCEISIFIDDPQPSPTPSFVPPAQPNSGDGN